MINELPARVIDVSLSGLTKEAGGGGGEEEWR